MVLEWEHENQAVIARLSNLIDMIKEATKSASGGKLEVRCSETTILHLHELSTAEQQEWNALPNKLHAMWASI